MPRPEATGRNVQMRAGDPCYGFLETPPSDTIA